MRATIAAAAASAVLLALASPAVGIWWLAWLAIVPVAALALREAGRPAGRVAVPLAYAIYLELLLVPSLPFGLTDGQWGDPPPLLVGGSPVLIVALIAVPLAGLALWGVRFGSPPAGPRGLPLPFPALAVLGPAVAWAALDFVRARIDPGGLWGPLPLTQAGEAPGSLAALAGPPLITFAIVAFNYAIALALVRRRALPLLAALVVGAAALCAPAVLAPATGAPIAVTAIQPGYDTAEEDRRQLRYWEPETYELAALDVIRDLGRVGAGAEGPALVVWPEGAVFVDPLAERPVMRAARRAARATGAGLVFPYFDYDASESGVFVLGPRGTPAGPSPKQRPMWFLGEDAIPGTARPLAAGRVAVGALLGVDAQDPGAARRLADEGAGLLASSTHDWEQLAPFQEAAAAIDAQATGLPLVRADWRYRSAIFDSEGERIASAGDGLERTAVSAEVPAGEPTPYTEVGDVAGWGALVLLLGWASLRLAALVRAR